MKKIFLLFAIVLLHFLSNAQAPQKMSYQAIVRNASNALVANASVSINLTLFQAGLNIYSENHIVTTNNNGLATLEIGTGTINNGVFADIDWSNGPYSIQTDIDPTGGTSWTISTTTDLLSVPYALYAAKAQELAKPLGKTYVIIQGASTNAQAAAQVAAEVGPNTQFVWVQNTTALTTIDLSSITNLIELKIINNTALTSINVSGLQEVVNLVNIDNNTVLPTFTMPAYTVNKASFTCSNNAALTTLDLPTMHTNNASFFVNNNAVITTISFAALHCQHYLSMQELLL
jgi:hypothetical protein